MDGRKRLLGLRGSLGLLMTVSACGTGHPEPGGPLGGNGTGADAGSDPWGHWTGTGGASGAGRGGATIVAGTTNAGGASSAGGSSSGGASTTGTPPANLPGDRVFAEHQILEFHLSLSEADWQELEEHGDREEYLPASATVTGDGFSSREFASVGLRHKGAYSLHHCWDNFGGVRSHTGDCQKLSYKIKFDEYESGSRLDGLKRINLHASSGDPTKLRELLAYDTFRSFGVDASRARPAKVYINGIYQGVFIAVEDLDGRYTKAHYPEGPNGNLYKEVWPRVEAADSDFVAALETNEDEADVSDMRRFAEAIAQASATTFREDMARWIDLDAVLRYIAVDRAIKNWDGIMAFYSPISPHNFFWYHEEDAQDRFHLIPWDLDNTFWPFDPYMHPQDWATAAPIPDWNSKPAHCEPRPVWTPDSGVYVTPPRCDPFLDLLAQTSYERFTELGQELLQGPLKFTTANLKIANWMTELEPLVIDDPTLDYAVWLQEISAFPFYLQRSTIDFQAFLAQGLIEETPPPDEPSEEELNAPTEDVGFQFPGITNFEFASAAPSAPAGLWTAGSPLASYVASWNTNAPLSGNADLRFDFTLRREPGAYDEWVNLGMYSLLSAEFDVRGQQALLLRLSSDRRRNIRVRVTSPAYDDTFGGAWSEFGIDLSVDASNQLYAIPLSALSYAEWAKAAWAAGQGWTTSDEEARDLVLSRCNGVALAPSATFDANGELASEEETGYVQVDNIYFR
ncbi:MAG TPA: CotH kinase family protein [Polyangiaceae bacterium]|nr:CotH kinase family protein [Polyangiaceae bacterium]